MNGYLNDYVFVLWKPDLDIQVKLGIVTYVPVETLDSEIEDMLANDSFGG